MKKTLAAAVLVAALAGCGGTAAAAGHRATPKPVTLTTLQACQQLRADILANGGAPDRPTIKRLSFDTAGLVIASYFGEIKIDPLGGGAYIPAEVLATCQALGVTIPVQY